MADLLDTEAVAQLANLKASTVRWYHKQGRMPEADMVFGRALVWNKETINDWIDSRKEKQNG
jgi:predicted DNA-binding transcriptional regulator AlpA